LAARGALELLQAADIRAKGVGNLSVLAICASSSCVSCSSCVENVWVVAAFAAFWRLAKLSRGDCHLYHDLLVLG
jgi:hypothetical protein